MDESEDDEITKTSTIYVLDKKLFVDSLEDTIKAFVNEEDYEKFVKNLQQELGDDDVGRIIENIYNLLNPKKIIFIDKEKEKYKLFNPEKTKIRK